MKKTYIKPHIEPLYIEMEVAQNGRKAEKYQTITGLAPE